MKKPSYKNLFLKEKSNKETYKECLDKLLEILKTFDNVEITEKTYDAIPLYKIRKIEVRQNDKYLQIALNETVMESDEVGR